MHLPVNVVSGGLGRLCGPGLCECRPSKAGPQPVRFRAVCLTRHRWAMPYSDHSCITCAGNRIDTPLLELESSSWSSEFVQGVPSPACLRLVCIHCMKRGCRCMALAPGRLEEFNLPIPHSRRPSTWTV